jgi:prepilin-type N-terminal cleavage/methylation domain-containing protein
MATRRRWQSKTQAGYSVAELTIVLAIVGVLSALATPLFLSYYQASRLRVGAEEIAAYINQGRQIAIKENTGVCLHITPTAVQYYVGSSVAGAQCTVTGLWTGPGTDSAGRVKVADGVALATASDLAFTYLGNATPATTVTVTNTQTNQTLHVAVALSGRVSIGP